jgi:hypothetical protein
MEEKAILEKLARILAILGEVRGRSTADLRRQKQKKEHAKLIDSFKTGNF